jgi:hypothetical protein
VGFFIFIKSSSIPGEERLQLLLNRTFYDAAVLINDCIDFHLLQLFMEVIACATYWIKLFQKPIS